MLKETLLGIENIQEIEVFPLRQIKDKESFIYNAVNKITTNTKVPLIPLIGLDGELTMQEIKLDEAYTLNETIDIANYDTWSDFKNEFANVTLENKKRLHFNKCLSLELNKVTNTVSDIKALREMASINNLYVIAVNNLDFKTLLAEVLASGERAVKKIGDRYFYQEVELIVLAGIITPVMLDLSELYLKEIVDIKEIKVDHDMLRRGIRTHNIQGFYGFGFINPSNIFRVATKRSK